MQSDSLDDETRTELWNVANTLRTILGEARRSEYSNTEENVLRAIWTWEYKFPADEQPRDDRVWELVKARILEAEWFDVLDHIEQVVGYVERYKDYPTDDAAAVMVGAYNDRFENYLVSYRFIGMEIAPIDITAEAQAVSDAIDDAVSITGARHHLERAVDLLSDRQSPDYPNSMKESISAVEAVCAAVTGENTLGAAIKKLQGAGVKIHPALERAWSAMYGWTSDADGIRHGSIEAPDADQALAKYMLVTCSAFVSHVIEAGRKAGLV
ncbi:MAG: hypothetical protein JWO18_770 [Microbacteriaceae bacterium]|nr:hypothetical protein [Microbacteriaceae bacterium]